GCLYLSGADPTSDRVWQSGNDMVPAASASARVASAGRMGTGFSCSRPPGRYRAFRALYTVQKTRDAPQSIVSAWGSRTRCGGVRLYAVVVSIRSAIAAVEAAVRWLI